MDLVMFPKFIETGCQEVYGNRYKGLKLSNNSQQIWIEGKKISFKLD